ncbi:unnamed protein product, partial [marine sediment metagenome]
FWKRRKRLEWSWVVVVVIAPLFAYATFQLASAGRLGEWTMNSTSSLLVGKDGRGKIVSHWCLYSPVRRSYDIDAGEGTCLPLASSESTRREHPVEILCGEGMKLPYLPIDMWSIKTFASQGTVQLGQQIESRLTYRGSRLEGEIKNISKSPIRNARLSFAGISHSLGNLPPQKVLQVEIDCAKRSREGFSLSEIGPSRASGGILTAPPFSAILSFKAPELFLPFKIEGKKKKAPLEWCHMRLPVRWEGREFLIPAGLFRRECYTLSSEGKARFP